MPKKIEMPPRQPDDRSVVVRREPDERITIGAETVDGRRESFTVSPYNAWRIFGCLSLMLEIPLPKTTGKAIKLGPDFSAIIE